MDRIAEHPSQRAAKLIQQIFDADQARDADAFVSVLTSEAQFWFGSAPPVSGRAAIRDSVAAFFTGLAEMHHELLEVWERGDTLVYQANVHYTRADGGELTLPYVNVLRLQGDLVKDYRIYIDPSPMRQG